MDSISFHHVITAALATALIALPSTAPAISDSCEYTGPPPPPQGSVVGQLRVMTMNVWGQNQDSERKCEARLRYIGERLANQKPLFDVIGLTEVHPDYVGMTCDGEKLVKGLRVNGQYGRRKARWGHPETSAVYYDGGTSIFSTSEFDWTPYSDHVERYSPKYVSRTAHGFVFARIPMVGERTSADGNGGRRPTTKDHRAGMVDVYVTHLYSKGGSSLAGAVDTGCDQQCRYGQLQQLARGIHERSANSGNPVLVMGDFNIGGPNPTARSCEGNPGYGDIMDVLRNPRDIWLEANPTNRKGATKVGNSNKRLDYIFVLTDPYFTNSDRQLVLSSSESVRLIDWKMPGYNVVVTGSGGFATGTAWKEGPFAVSDHYGIAATFEIQRLASDGGSTPPARDRGTSGPVVRDHRGDPNPRVFERPEGSVVENHVVKARRGNPPVQCSRASKTLCESNGATCEVVRAINDSEKDVCRWSAATTANKCRKTVGLGLWVAANSKYARNHPDAVATGAAGACMTEVKNLENRIQ